MTTLAELVNTPPVATHGVPAGFVFGAGEWRHVIEVADPAEGSAVQWYDITAYFAGYDYSLGAANYNGRYQSSVATIDLFADDDRLAPWNDYNMLGIELGPGLLIRSSFIRVDGGVVAEWNARFTNKVESWSDDSHSQGRVRRHTVVARDTLTSLVDVPIPARPEENWTLHLIHLIGDSGWPYGQVVFGAQFTSGGVPIKLLPARQAAPSAISELDAILDPVGLMWYTNQRGQLMIRPHVYDTFHAAAFAAGASGGPWTDPEPVVFRWDACMGGGGVAYAVDTNAVNPFGIDKTELSVINHVMIKTEASGSILDNLYDDDNPISIQRYDRQTFQATWIAPNNIAAGDLLAYRAFATNEARPLTTTMEMEGFFPDPSPIHLSFNEPVTIVHRNRNDGPEVTATGFMRGYRERIVPRGCDTEWSLEITVDIASISSTDSPVPTGLLPVEDLVITVQTDTTATFTWSNPGQTITPTNTQIRMLDATADWETVEYPITTAAWAHLSPSTGYQFEVRLIRIVDGVVTHFSPLRSRAFYTLDPATPHVDEDDDGLHIHFPPSDCPLEWILEQSLTGDDPWTTIDSGTAPTGSVDYDPSALDPEQWYRVQSREVCPGEDPGPWIISDPFPVGCVTTDRLSEAPYDDADLFAYWPQDCLDHIEEAVSHTPLALGSAFDRVGPDLSGNTVMMSFAKGVIGNSDVPAPPAGTTDQTISCRVMIATLPGSEQLLFQFGGMVIAIRNSGSGFAVSGFARHSGGSSTEAHGTTVLTTFAIYDFVLVHDVGVALTLYVNGSEEATSAATPARLASSTSIQLPATSWITDCAAWDRVLTASEIPGGVGSTPVTFIGASTIENINAASSVAVSLPPCDIGDLRIIHVGITNATTPLTTITVPSGWTTIVLGSSTTSSPAGQYDFLVCYRVKQTFDTDADVTVSTSAGAATYGTAVAYAFADVDISGSIYEGLQWITPFDPGTSFGAPDVTTTGPNRLILYLFGADNAGALSLVAGTASEADNQDNTWGAMLLATEATSVAGTYSAAQANQVLQHVWAVNLALIPAI